MRTGTGTGVRRRAGLRSGMAGMMVGLAAVTVAIIPASVVGASPTPVPACPAPVVTGGTAVVTCTYDGSGQTWTVPTGVTSAIFDVAGAQGGSASGIAGGEGGEVTAVLAVTGGTEYSVLVGAQGGSINGCPSSSGGAGGFGGGGAGGADLCPGGGGGGESSVADADTLELVAGGGGGGSNCSDASPAAGGAGGGLTGAPGQSAEASLSPTGGAPGTQTSGGVATGTATSGQPGQGGAGGTQNGCGGNIGTAGGGGGGGGYFGGAGGDGNSNGAGGGGGSGFAATVLSPTFYSGVRSGNGVVTITYSTVSITGVSVTGSPSSPVLTINGSGFGTEANLGTPQNVAGYSSSCTGFDYESNLYLVDSWSAGQGAPAAENVVGLFISSYSDTQIVFTFGSCYPADGVLGNGDSYSVTLLGTTFSGTVAYVPPTISTTAAVTGSAVLGAGGTISDTATVTSTTGIPTPTGSVKFYLCQVSTSTTLTPGLCPATGTPTSGTLSGSGGTAKASSKPFAPTGAGTWCYGTTYAGDTDNVGTADNITGTADANECLLVSAASPSITTTPAATSITLGPTPPTLKDTAVLSGGYNPAGTITFTLYNPAGAKVDTETATVSGNGSYTTATGYTLPKTGTITGTYQWDASYASADVNNNAVSENNAPAEQVKVASPCGSLTAYFLSATYAGGSFTGLFCVNAAGTGTYAQNGGTAVTAKVLSSGATTAVSASGTGLVLLGQKTGTSGTFTETAPAPMKTGTFTLTTVP